MGLVSLLFGFKGRINRVQYWLGCVGAGVGGALLFFALGLLFLPAGPAPKTSEGMLQVLSGMGLTLGVPLMLMGWVGMALQTKRFHDRGRSGLWTLLPMLPVTMIVINIMGGLSTGAPPEAVASSIGMWFLLLQGVNLFMFIDLGCMPSKEGPNKYGNPPGGGFTGGAPAGGPIPTQAAPAKDLAIPGMGSALVGAESAIDRAIAARAKQTQAPLPATARTPFSQPMPGLRPAVAGPFGRKTTR